MASLRNILKIYSLCWGCIISFLAFLWVAFELYVVSQTPPDQTDLLMARYLDICFGLLAFSSSLALMYGCFVESKTWISVWTLGSATVLVGCWVWFFYRKYGYNHPESLRDTQTVGVILTMVYLCISLPVWIYYRKFLEARDHFLAKPWCISAGSAGISRSSVNASPGATYFFIPNTNFCSWSSFRIFSPDPICRCPSGQTNRGSNSDPSHTSGRRVEEDLYNPV